MDQLFKDELRRRYGGPREPQASELQFKPDFPIFRQHARTGASRYYGTLRGDRFGRVYVHSPESITIEEFDEMRMDGQCRAGLMLLKLPIQRSPWQVNCQDSDIANLVQEILKPKWARTIRHILLALDFGFMLGEKLWATQYNVKVSNTQAALGSAAEKLYPTVVGLDELMEIDPLTIKLLAYNRSGKFAGFEQFTPRMAQVPAHKAFHFANDMEFSELYGVSRLKPCYPYWIFKRSMYEWTNVGYEKNSLPIRKVRYPEGRTETGVDQNGNPLYLNNDQQALNVGESLDNMNVVAVPSSRYDDKAMAMWDVEFMENPFNGADIISYIDHLNAQILKALLIPELALNTGSSGSYDLAQEQIRFFMLGLETLMDQVEEAVNEQIIKPLVRYNFGPHAPACYLKFQPLADDMREGLTNLLFETIGQGQPIPLKDGSQMIVDWQKVADDSGIPVDILTEEDMAMYRQAQSSNQAAMPQQMGPDGQPMGGDMPGGAPPQGGGDRGGFGASGGASNQPQNQQQANPGDDESGEMGLSDILELANIWNIQNGELVLS